MEERRGSTRIITAVEPGVIAMQYTDQWSAFDRGPSPQTISKLGAARCACAVKSFMLASMAGVPTHFVRQADEVTIHVEEFFIPNKPSLSGKTVGRVIPLEWIYRLVADGSLFSRLEKGIIDPVLLGFAPGTKVTRGMKLPRMRLECTTKFEPVDRHLSEEEAKKIGFLTDKEWGDAWDLLWRWVGIVVRQYRVAGFNIFDGKGELGMTHPEGKIVGVDVFGTPDENRILDAKTGEIYSKDLLRNLLIRMGWKDELDRAKADYPADKEKWPPYPRLSDIDVELVAGRYIEVAKRYAEVNI